MSKSSPPNKKTKPKTPNIFQQEKVEDDKLTQIVLSFNKEQFSKIEDLRKQCNSPDLEDLINKLFVIGKVYIDAAANNFEFVVVDSAKASVFSAKTPTKRKVPKKLSISGNEESVVFITDTVNNILGMQKELEVAQTGLFGMIPIANA